MYIDIEGQYWIQRENIGYRRTIFRYRGTILDAEKQYSDKNRQYWIQRNNIGYRESILDT